MAEKEKDPEKVKLTETLPKFLDKLQHQDTLRKHCEHACVMSYYKYDHVDEYVMKRAPVYLQAAQAAYERDGNSEHLVDVVNYAMFAAMGSLRNLGTGSYDKWLSVALEADAIYNEDDYHPTDSSGSTRRVSFREQVYEILSVYPKAPSIENGYL